MITTLYWVQYNNFYESKEIVFRFNHCHQNLVRGCYLIVLVGHHCHNFCAHSHGKKHTTWVYVCVLNVVYYKIV